MEKLLKWMENKGFKGCDLQTADFEDTGRGLMALKDFQGGDILLEIPDNLIITTRTVMSSPIGEIVAGQNLTPLQVLCLFLMCERWTGVSSEWFHYIQSLPRSYTTPVSWADSLTQRLPPALAGLVDDQQRSVRTLYDRCAEAISQLERRWPALRGGLTYESFCWAWSTVNTRCVYWLKDDDPRLAKDGEDHYALVPFLDLINHSTSVQAEAGYDAFTRSYRMKTLTPIAKESQAFTQYGPFPNLKLLLEYGFCLPGNSTNFIHVEMGDIMSAMTDLGLVGTDEHHQILAQNQLDRGHGCSIEGLTWSLQVTLKILALGKNDLHKWTSCLEDEYISNSHGDATDGITTKLMNDLISQYEFQYSEHDGDIGKMVKLVCEEYCNILRTCLPTVDR